MDDVKNKAWFMKYVPETADDLIFDNDEHKEVVNRWINNQFIDGNVLFYGPYGLGKTATAEILIRKIIKAQNDLLIASERSANEVRERITPFVKNRPVKSNQKIVFIEEMDKLHSAAFNLLKTGLMEKYQETASFIACTNYIKKVEGAVLTRFNYKIPFTGQNTENIVKRLKYILESENAEFDEEELERFVRENQQAGVRELINQLQNSYLSNNGVINFTNISAQAGIEETIIQLIHKMLTAVASMDVKSKSLCINFPLESAIADDYKQFVTLVNNNYDINYNSIYDRLYETTTYVPIKMICARYAEQQDFRKFPQVNLIAFIYEVMKVLAEVNRW